LSLRRVAARDFDHVIRAWRKDADESIGYNASVNNGLGKLTLQQQSKFARSGGRRELMPRGAKTWPYPFIR